MWLREGPKACVRGLAEEVEATGAKEVAESGLRYVPLGLRGVVVAEDVDGV